MRLYHFSAGEIADDEHPDLDLEIDPKLAWALRHPEYFPLDVNRADYTQILRVPGIGIKSAQRIVIARRHCRLTAQNLARMGVVMKRARYFLSCRDTGLLSIQEAGPQYIRDALCGKRKFPRRPYQLSLFV